jgi:hypothetical protein
MTKVISGHSFRTWQLFHIQNDFSGAETAFHPRLAAGWLHHRPPTSESWAQTGRIQASNYVLAALEDLQTTGFDEIKQ